MGEKYKNNRYENWAVRNRIIGKCLGTLGLTLLPKEGVTMYMDKTQTRLSPLLVACGISIAHYLSCEELRPSFFPLSLC